MGFLNSLDRLVIQQIHLAEKGEAQPDSIRRLLADLAQLGGARPATAYAEGYAKALLGIECSGKDQDDLRRWRLYGALVAHDRRGERSWIADLLTDSQVLADLLHDATLAALVLPLCVRTLFFCGDLRLALRAIGYLSAQQTTPESALVVDAALADLLPRLQARQEAQDDESTASLLRQAMDIAAFGRLPQEVQARYHKALAERLLGASEWQAAGQEAQTAAQSATGHGMLQSACRALAALSTLRVHSLTALEPKGARPERAEAQQLLGEAGGPDAAPAAQYVTGILHYEEGAFSAAAEALQAAIDGLRRQDGRDEELLDRARFFHAAALLAEGKPENSSRALKAMDKALDTVRPDLDSFYSVHEALKKLDRKVALRFLDQVEIGRGTSADQLLFVALEYLALGEGDAALKAAERVLTVAVDLDQRLEAMRVMLTSHNMKGERAEARACFETMRDLLMQRGAFAQLERLLQDEAFVGQALDHLDVKLELASLYDEMEGKDYERAQLQLAIARSLRARKDVEFLQQAHGLLADVACRHPELAQEDLKALEKLLELSDAEPIGQDEGAAASQALSKRLGRPVRALVVGGNERQRRHHDRLVELGGRWSLDCEWLETNYTSPQKIVAAIGYRLQRGIDLLVLLHWNRHETTEPALELARKAKVPARTVHYAGFTSLQVALG